MLYSRLTPGRILRLVPRLCGVIAFRKSKSESTSDACDASAACNSSNASDEFLLGS
eukprot:m.358581 g.358581  ORF g.358581 m.358581 type:complete len:56 (+) comp55987_c0_seq30:1940-2107(+)